jgi:Flp pilus assembly protein TadD
MVWNSLKKEDNLILNFCFPKIRKGWRFLPVLIISSLFCGCATSRLPKTDSIHIDSFPAYEMPDGSKIDPASINGTIPDIDILAINDDIKSLLDKKVIKIKGSRDRLETLANILIEKIQYDTTVDPYGVKTAQETFDTGTGNCLSFSNLFIAMARYVGFRAKFSEIPTLPNWNREGEIIFFTRHIGASVDIRTSASQLIQLEVTDNIARIMALDATLKFYFAPSELAPGNSRVNAFRFQAVSDNRAFAQYYNNLGSKQLAEGNAPEAFRYFIKSIKTDSEVNFVWSNLGVVYRRNNQLDAAEEAYLQGLSVTQGPDDTSVLTIINNLANLYDVTGEEEKSAFYKNQIASFRERNPYYQYGTGKAAYYDSLFEESIALFRKAIRLKDDEPLFYYNLALAYMKTGEIKKAERNINKAIKYSWDRGSREYYENFLETIRNAN